VILTILAIATIPFNIIDTFAQTSETWKEYVDPQGEFSIQYPPSWDLKPSNRFEATDLMMYSPGGSENGYVLLQYNIFSEEIGTVLDKYGGDQSDIEKYLDIVFPSFLKGFSESMDNFNQVERIDYNKYKIDGYKAASIIFSFEIQGLDVAGWLVWTLLGSNMFVFEFVASTDNFDSLLPIGERMLNSIKILDYQNSLVNEEEENDEDE
jgi:hypothetical protein